MMRQSTISEAESTLSDAQSFKIGKVRVDSSSNNSTFSRMDSDLSENISLMSIESGSSSNSKGKNLFRVNKRKAQNAPNMNNNNSSKVGGHNQSKTLEIIEEWGFKKDAVK